MVGLNGYRELGSPPLQRVERTVTSYGGHVFKVIGKLQLSAKIQFRERNVTLLVVDAERGSSLLGQDWSDAFGLTDYGLSIFSQPDLESYQIGFSEDVCNVSEIIPVPEKIKQLSVKYPEVFKAGLSKCTIMKAHIALKPDATGRKFFKPRDPGYAKLEGTKAEIERLVAQGILYHVD